MQVNKIAVIGLGRVGLPLALVLADNGFNVLGIDRNLEKIEKIKKKKMPFKETGAEDLLLKYLNKNFKLGKVRDIATCKTLIICIGTFLNDDLTPDIRQIFKLLDEILPYVAKNTLFILRSTVHPHGTEQINDYIKKNFKGKFDLIYAPERIAEGFATEELYEIPQIIGSFDKKSAKMSESIFKKFSPEIIQTDTLTAELAKLILNTHRYANFAVANELMMIVDYYGRDIYKVLNIANKNYIRGSVPNPGFAGGPCLAKDSFFLKYKTPFNTLITGAFTVNDRLSDYLISKIMEQVNLKKEKVALLGLSFKKNIDDDRGSLSLKMLNLLKTYSSKISVHDPYLANSDLKSVLHRAKVVILAVDHDEYKSIGLNGLKKMVGEKTLVCDVWNVFGKDKIFFNLI